MSRPQLLQSVLSCSPRDFRELGIADAWPKRDPEDLEVSPRVLNHYSALVKQEGINTNFKKWL